MIDRFTQRINVTLPVELINRIDRVTNNRSGFLARAAEKELKNKEDNIQILQSELNDIETKKLELAKQLEEEIKSKQEYYAKNKEKANKTYMQILKYLKISYQKYHDFVFNEELSFELEEYCKLTGEKRLDVKTRAEEEVLMEINNGNTNN